MPNYKPPKEARQRLKDRAYIEFQREPVLNEATRALHHHKGQCETIFGGALIWLQKAVRKPNGQETHQGFPIVIDGRRCPNQSVKSRSRDGKTSRRCVEHTFEQDWIKIDPLLEPDE